MSDQAEGQNEGGQRDGQEGPQVDGGGEIGEGQGGGGQPPLAYHNAAQFLAAWNAAPSDQAKDNLEQEGNQSESSLGCAVCCNVEDQPANVGVGGSDEHQSEPGSRPSCG
jgi:hypothetical protein